MKNINLSLKIIMVALLAACTFAPVVQAAQKGPKAKGVDTLFWTTVSAATIAVGWMVWQTFVVAPKKEK
jgi:hypothetical protein